MAALKVLHVSFGLGLALVLLPTLALVVPSRKLGSGNDVVGQGRTASLVCLVRESLEVWYGSAYWVASLNSVVHGGIRHHVGGGRGP